MVVSQLMEVAPCTLETEVELRFSWVEIAALPDITDINSGCLTTTEHACNAVQCFHKLHTETNSHLGMLGTRVKFTRSLCMWVCIIAIITVFCNCA